MALSTSEKITLWGLIAAILIGISAFFVPEVRYYFGLENSNKIPGKTETSNITVEKTATPNAANANPQNFNDLKPISAEEVVGSNVIATRFDVALNDASTYVAVSVKLKNENAKYGDFYGNVNSYLADPDGKIYNIQEPTSNTYSLRQHEVYIQYMKFQKLKSKPPFLYFHYEGYNNFPLIILKLNWE